MAIDGRDTGTVENVFPDGIHMVRLDNSDRVVAVTASHLTRLEVAAKHGHVPPRPHSRNKTDQAR